MGLGCQVENENASRRTEVMGWGCQVDVRHTTNWKIEINSSSKRHKKVFKHFPTPAQQTKSSSNPLSFTPHTPNGAKSFIGVF